MIVRVDGFGVEGWRMHVDSILGRAIAIPERKKVDMRSAFSCWASGVKENVARSSAYIRSVRAGFIRVDEGHN